MIVSNIDFFLENLLDARKKMSYLVDNTDLDEEPINRLRKTKTKIVMLIPPKILPVLSPLSSTPTPSIPCISTNQPVSFQSLMSSPLPTSEIQYSINHNSAMPSYLPASSPFSSTPTTPIPNISDNQQPLSFQSQTSSIVHNQQHNPYSFPQNVYEPPYPISWDEKMKSLLNGQREMTKQLKGTKILLLYISVMYMIDF